MLRAPLFLANLKPIRANNLSLTLSVHISLQPLSEVVVAAFDLSLKSMQFDRVVLCKLAPFNLVHLLVELYVRVRALRSINRCVVGAALVDFPDMTITMSSHCTLGRLMSCSCCASLVPARRARPTHCTPGGRVSNNCYFRHLSGLLLSTLRGGGISGPPHEVISYPVYSPSSKTAFTLLLPYHRDAIYKDHEQGIGLTVSPGGFKKQINEA